MVRLSFTPIPEIMAADAFDVVDKIYDRRQIAAPSYGAFLIRGANATLAQACAERFVNKLDKILMSHQFDGDGLNRGLHADGGTANEMTSHLTTVGSAEVIVLTDRYPDPPHRMIAHNEEMTAAFQGDYDDLGVAVSQAFKAHVAAGDLLLFDHGQRHAFWGTADRKSQAYYY